MRTSGNPRVRAAWRLLCITLACGWAHPVLAGERGFEGFSLTVGVADRNHGYEPVEDTWVGRIGARWKWFPSDPSGVWGWRGFLELEGGYWRWDDKRVPRRGDSRTAEFALTPVFRLERLSGYEGGARPFVEGAIGINYLTEQHVSSRNLGSNFHFGSHVGAGWYFGANDRYELGLHIHHLSNAGIEEPNPGINFALIKFAFRP